jgi:hypothetical protein
MVEEPIEVAPGVYKLGSKYYEKHPSGLLLEIPYTPEPTEEEWEKGEEC